jgi:hypothetical protein
MPWIESHTVLLRHRKVLQLADDLSIQPVYVIGHLHALWHCALEQQEDGDLSEWPDSMIAQAAAYPGDALHFVKCLQARGWLDGKLVHDWLEYAGKYLESKYRTSNPEKLKKIWKCHERSYNKVPGRKESSEWFRVRLIVLQRDNYTCAYCGVRKKYMEVDHKVSVKDGGSYSLDNLVTSCKSCNRKKSSNSVWPKSGSSVVLGSPKASPPNLTRPNLTNLTNLTGPNQPTEPTSSALAAPSLIETLVDLWNLIPGVIKAKAVTGPIRKRLLARIEEHPDLVWWTTYFDRIRDSEFLTGRSKVDFAATLDWVIGPKNMAKILNGNYDGRVKAPQEESVIEKFLKRGNHDQGTVFSGVDATDGAAVGTFLQGK